MAEPVTITVTGLKEFLELVEQAPEKTRKLVHKHLEDAVQGVVGSARRRFVRRDVKTAYGFKAQTTRSGVSVVQSLLPTTGLHPEFGRLQMREALIPALNENRDEAEEALEKAAKELVRSFP